jgi:amino acid transporter
VDWQHWLVFAHVLGAFTFVLAHGVSVFAALKIRREHDATRIAALLDLSKSALTIAGIALLYLIATGIGAGFVGDFWGQRWIWVSIAILVLLFAYMSFRGTRYHDALRHSVGSIGIYDHKATEGPPPDPAALAALLDSPRAIELAAVGGIGLVAILYLMAFRPF